MTRLRRSHDAPAAVAEFGWRYHHLGIPHKTPRAEEQHLESLGVHVCGFETSPYGIEWMRFEAHCPVPEIVKTVAHVAFEVDDLDEALRGREILIAPNAPSSGVRVAFILDDGAPIELLEFEKARPQKRCGHGHAVRRGRHSHAGEARFQTPRAIGPDEPDSGCDPGVG